MEERMVIHIPLIGKSMIIQ